MPLPNASNYPSAYDTDLTLLGDPADQQSFTLASSIGQGDTVFTVNEAITSVNIPCQLVWATGEICWATNKNDGTKQFTVERGASVPHTTGEGIRLALTALYVKQIKKVLLAIEGALGLSPQGSFATVASRIADLASRMAAREVLSVGHTHDGSESGGSNIPPTSITPQGASSGLDADKLDGQHGSYYSQTGRLIGANGGTKVIVGGVITCNVSNGYAFFVIDTEGSAASDDLDTISGLADGDVVQLILANANRKVTVKHNTGNFMLPNSRYLVLSTENSIMFRFDGSKLRITGGGVGKDYFLLKTQNVVVSGGWMSTVDKQTRLTRLAGASNAWVSNWAQLLDGLTADVDSGVRRNAYPTIAFDFGAPAALDAIRSRVSTQFGLLYLYGSPTGAFAGEEETILDGVGAGGMDVTLTFNPRIYRYWKIKGYYADPNNNHVGQEYDFRYNSTFMIAGIPYGSKVALYSGVTLKETSTQANTIYQYGLLMFTTPANQFDTVKIYLPEDPATVWMTFAVSASSGDIYTLYLK
jgi:hypothetical protein